MAFSEKFIRTQLMIFKPFVEEGSLQLSRKSQDKLGELMAISRRRDVTKEDISMGDFVGSMITPKDEERNGVILYLHGGGYTCGSLEYCKGFGTTLAVECGMRVFCCAYRLAPENPYPAALDDALQSYRYLLDKGFLPQQIVLCGESAGGGLLYALCLKLKELNMMQPAGQIAVSPWTDLTSSGDSYEKQKDIDPSMTKERLQFFASCYTKDAKNPLVSPIFGEVSGLSPSLIFVGGDEIMQDDAKGMHKKLLDADCTSRLITKPHMWHAYVLYGLKEHHEADFREINLFLDRVLTERRPLRWMRLDNAAKIFPASRRRNWNNVFRLSVTLKEEIDPKILQKALDITVRRFPSIAVRLRHGMFWYYLEEIEKAPQVRQDSFQPLTRMPFDDIRKCAFRVLYYEKRVAAEFFHAVTDGNGGLVFLKTLVAEYLVQKYGVAISNTDGVFDRFNEPCEEELEDSFQKNTGLVSVSRKEERVFPISGTPEPDGFLHVTCGQLDAEKVQGMCRSYGVSVTAFLCAVMLASIIEIQNERVPDKRRQKQIKVQIPVNLRKLFDSKTMRNFIMVIKVGVNPKMGEFSFEELLKIVHHQMGLAVTKKNMQAIFTTNVNSEKSLAVKLVPLFIKNIVLRLVFDVTGERAACLCFSNLGATTFPEEMIPFVQRVDFLLGSQSTAPYNCGVISCNNLLCINLVRNTMEPVLERHFFTYLRRLGLHVKIESNQR